MSQFFRTLLGRSVASGPPEPSLAALGYLHGFESDENVVYDGSNRITSVTDRSGNSNTLLPTVAPASGYVLRVAAAVNGRDIMRLTGVGLNAGCRLSNSSASNKIGADNFLIGACYKSLLSSERTVYSTAALTNAWGISLENQTNAGKVGFLSWQDNHYNTSVTGDTSTHTLILARLSGTFKLWLDGSSLPISNPSFTAPTGSGFIGLFGETSGGGWHYDVYGGRICRDLSSLNSTTLATLVGDLHTYWHTKWF